MSTVPRNVVERLEEHVKDGMEVSHALLVVAVELLREEVAHLKTTQKRLREELGRER